MAATVFPEIHQFAVTSNFCIRTSNHKMLALNALDYWTQAATARLSALDDRLASFGCKSIHTDFLKLVDEEISAVQRVVSSLFVWRSRLSPVSRLPPELLARIFSFLADDEIPGIDSRPRLGWIKVSHVCSRWRCITLDTPGLWATINFDIGPQWVLSMVERARSAPLIVHHTHIRTMKDRDTVIDLVSSHLSTISKLELVVLNDALDDVMVKALSGTKPSLEHGPLTTNGTVDLEAIPSDALPDPNSPRLCAVTFVGCRVPWASSIWHNVSHLKISMTSKQWIYLSDRCWLPSKDRFFGMLASMHHLESLSICNYFYQSLDTSASDRMRQPALELNHLSHLVLKGSWARCIVILGSIQFPPTAAVSLTCRESNDDFVDEVLIPMLRRHSGKTGEAPPLHTVLLGKWSRQLTIEGWTTSDEAELDLAGRLSRTTPSLSLLLHTKSDCRNVEGMYYSIIRAVHIQEVSYLGLGLEGDVHEEHRDIFNLLESAQKLETITLQDEAFYLFCAWLDAEQTDARDGHIPFPKLRMMNFQQCESEPGIQHGEQILEWLKRRKSSQAPLERFLLHVKEDGRTKRWVDRLGRIAPLKVRWKDHNYKEKEPR